MSTEKREGIHGRIDQLKALRSNARNSEWRGGVIDNITQGITAEIHERAPWVSADLITALSAIGVIAGAYLAKHGRKVEGGASMLLGGIGDKLDGDMARLIMSEDPSKHNRFVGQIADALGDRAQEVGVGIIHAFETKNYASLLFAATATVPSFIRALGESRGIVFPESGKNILQFFGTRGGRFMSLFLGSMTDGKFQIALDGGTAVANIVTATDRAAHLVKNWNNDSGLLSDEDKKEGTARALALGLFAGFAVGLSAYGAKKLHDEKRKEKEKIKAERARWKTSEGRVEADELYAQDTTRANRVLKEVNGVFVGGTFTDLLNLNTKAAFNFDTNTITLTGHNAHSILREDGTVKDTDAICFEEDREKVKVAQQRLHEEHQLAEAARRPHSFVNMEPTSYYPGWPERSTLTQFTSGIDVQDGKPYLVFGKLRKEISWDSLEAWNIQLEDGTEFRTLSPFAHLLRYAMRVPSGLKPKDTAMKKTPDGRDYNKLDLVKLVAKQASPDGNWQDFWMNYKGGIYRPWIEFIQEMHTVIDPTIAIKARVTGLYWNTIGPTLAHGADSGILKWISEKSGAFTGQK